MQISGTVQSRQQVLGLCMMLSRHGLACVELKGCCRPLQGSRRTLGSPVRRCRVAFCGGPSKDSSKLVLATETADCHEAVASLCKCLSRTSQSELSCAHEGCDSFHRRTRSAGMAAAGRVDGGRMEHHARRKFQKLSQQRLARHWLLCLTTSRSNIWRT